jgi:hypothetical protein
MTGPVTIENDALCMEVWPSLGGKVSSLVDKSDDFELLFNYPAELPTAPQYDIAYGKSWCAGWDECFPAVAPGRYVGHPYDGISIPDHGELWGIPTTAVPSKDGITIVWHGLRFGYRLTRKLSLEGAPVRAHYTLINLAPFEFRFIWAMHALLAMESPVEVGFDESAGFRLSHDADGNDLQKSFDWPRLDRDIDLSRPSTLPTRQGWKIFSTGPIRAPARVKYPSRNRSLRIEYASDNLPAFWGLWINTGGWAGYRHLALEPTTGRFDEIDRCVKDGSAGRVMPAGRCDWSVTISVE